MNRLPPSFWSSKINVVCTFYLHLQLRVLALISQDKKKIQEKLKTLLKLGNWTKFFVDWVMYEQRGEMFSSILPLIYIFFSEIFTSLMIVDNLCHQGHLKIKSREISEVKCQRWGGKNSVSAMYIICNTWSKYWSSLNYLFLTFTIFERNWITIFKNITLTLSIFWLANGVCQSCRRGYIIHQSELEERVYTVFTLPIIHYLIC